jgi:hypothetical protein
MKTEVYSWRVSTEIKTGLEREARRRKISLSAVLDLAAREWLEKGDPEREGAEEQLRLRKAASGCFGALASGDAQRSENARQAFRNSMRKRYGR